MKKRLALALGIIFIFLFSFIYITASGITQLSNEHILYLFLDETKRDPGTVEVASLAIYENGNLKQSLIKVNPLSTTEALRDEGISISDALIKTKSVPEGLSHVKTIAEQETNMVIDRIVLVDSSAFKSMIEAVHPIPIEKHFTVTVLDKTFDLYTKTIVSGDQAEKCIRGINYPGIDNPELMEIPEDYLWEVKAEIINHIGNKVLDLSSYTKSEQQDLASAVLNLYKNEKISVYERTTVLTMVYYLPEFISRQIVNFAVRRLT